jgi:hypothetical protein
MLASMGSPECRLTSTGKHNFRLYHQFQSYAKQDDWPSRVKPVPIQVIHHATQLAVQHNTAESLAVIHTITIAYFFLMRPGEHTAPTGKNALFCLCNIQLHCGQRRYTGALVPLHFHLAASFITYTFTTQKNSVRGKVIGLGCIGHTHCCPIEATGQGLIHLRLNNGPADTPLCTYFYQNGSHFVTSANITTTLWASVTALRPGLGFVAKDISAARSLRASCAMALLCANINTDTIRLIGCWRSDKMMRYLSQLTARHSTVPLILQNC